jgi:monothiol bacilliredoxin
MGNHFQRVTRAHEFMELLARSQERPVIIFKHSTTCPISAAAYYEMEDFEGDVVLIEVQNARELSREVEKLTGIRHESPQVLILKKGEVVWNASHRSVKALAVAEAITGLGKQ